MTPELLGAYFLGIYKEKVDGKEGSQPDRQACG
jgi:hypothetical protein